MNRIIIYEFDKRKLEMLFEKVCLSHGNSKLFYARMCIECALELYFWNGLNYEELKFITSATCAVVE